MRLFANGVVIYDDEGVSSIARKMSDEDFAAKVQVWCRRRCSQPRAACFFSEQDRCPACCAIYMDYLAGAVAGAEIVLADPEQGKG